MPAIPGIGDLGPGSGPSSSVRTLDGHESFLAAPVCSSERSDLCLKTKVAAKSAPQAAPGGVETPLLASAARSEAHEASTPNDFQPTPEPQLSPEPTPEPWGQMEVRPGDTLIALAGWFGVSPFDIAVTNGAAVDDYLVIGTTLVIPVPESEFVMPPVPDVTTPTDAPLAITPAPAPPPPPEPEPIPEPTLPPTPAPPPPPSSGPWTTAEVIEAICSLPWPCEKMVAIASCESGLNPSAVNPIGYYGLFQINYVFDGWDNPWTNAQVAYYDKYLPALQYGDGLTPWPVCRYY